MEKKEELFQILEQVNDKGREFIAEMVLMFTAGQQFANVNCGQK